MNVIQYIARSAVQSSASVQKHCSASTFEQAQQIGVDMLRAMHSLHRGAAALLTRSLSTRPFSLKVGCTAPAPCLWNRPLADSLLYKPAACMTAGSPQHSCRWSAASGAYASASDVEDAPAANVGRSRQYPDEPRVIQKIPTHSPLALLAQNPSQTSAM